MDTDSNDFYLLDDKFPAEKWPLTFDFTKRLPAGVFLSGVPVVSIAVTSGTDSAPSAMFNGAAGFDNLTTPQKVIVPIMGGIGGTTYEIEVDCPTTQANLVVTLVGVLNVISGPASQS